METAVHVPPMESDHALHMGVIRLHQPGSRRKRKEEEDDRGEKELNMPPRLLFRLVNFSLEIEAIQCLGGNGYVNEYPTGRLLRDAKLFEIGAGTSEIRRMIIGRELFKEQ
ncbi:Isovaleryl-CoA dehydrogenase [Nymphaea thermarum]|nr:Isovaleryl-CoA dehydrogenase [Nymphaea thermarum]